MDTTPDQSRETDHLLGPRLDLPSTSSEDYVFKKHVNRPRFLIPDHGTFLATVGNREEISSPRDSPVAIELARCKRLVMRPYIILLKLIGWHPLYEYPKCLCHSVLNVLHPAFVILFILFGYVIELAACFRRDETRRPDGKYPWNILMMEAEGTTPSSMRKDNVTTGDWVCRHYIGSQFILNDILHSAAYIYSFIVFRVLKSEQLTTLMEWVFLQTSPTQGGFLSQGRLIRSLRNLFILCVLWAVLSHVSLITHIIVEYFWGQLTFYGLEPGSEHCIYIILIVLLDVSYLMVDLVYVAVVLNYSVQCLLLLSYIHGLKEKIREHTKSLEEVIKDIFKMESHLEFLNHHPGTAVSIVIFIFSTMAITGFAAVVDQHNNFIASMYVSTILAIILWSLAVAVPVILAAKLTAACNSLRRVGREIRTRPFGYQEESLEVLDSFLLYTSTLQLKAKMFLIPVLWSWVCAVFVVTAAVLMLLFQMGVLDHTPAGTGDTESGIF